VIKELLAFTPHSPGDLQQALSVAVDCHNEKSVTVLANWAVSHAQDFDPRDELVNSAINSGAHRILKVLIACREAQYLYRVTNFSFMNQLALDGKSDALDVLLDFTVHSAHTQGRVQRLFYCAAQCTFDSLRLMEALIQHGANVDSVDSILGSALSIAIEFGNAAAVELLLRKGANKNAIFHNQTMVGLAVEKDRESILRTLLEHEVDMNQQSFFREREPFETTSPLERAIFRGLPVIVHTLLEFGAVATSTDSSRPPAMPLAIAIKRGTLAVVNMLLERGADVHHESVQLSLHHLVHLPCTSLGDSYIDIMTLLFKHGLDPNSRIPPTGETHLTSMVREGNESRVKFLLNNGARVNQRDTNGETVLFEAVRRGLPAILRILLQNGGEVNTQSNAGTTALDHCPIQSSEDVADFEDTVFATLLEARAMTGVAVRESAQKSLVAVLTVTCAAVAIFLDVSYWRVFGGVVVAYMGAKVLFSPNSNVGTSLLCLTGCSWAIFWVVGEVIIIFI
jgi:ankyrin repeat protein